MKTAFSLVKTHSGMIAFLAFFLTLQSFVAPDVSAQQRIKEIANVAGERSNQLIGYGLVVGLDGSGDQTTQSPLPCRVLWRCCSRWV